MIVSVTVPAGTSQIKYGACIMAPDPGNTIPVPDYVAKTLCTLPGFSTSPALTLTPAQLLAAGPASANWQASYLLRAWNKPLSGDTTADFNAATALLAAQGAPAVSAT